MLAQRRQQTEPSKVEPGTPSKKGERVTSMSSAYRWMIVVIGLVLLGLAATPLRRESATRSSIIEPVPKEAGALIDTMKENSKAPGADMTIFTLLMDMDEGFKTSNPVAFWHQWNAIQSWKRIVPAQNILIFAADSFSCDYIQKELGAQCLLDIDCINDDLRRTDLSCVWRQAHELAKTDFLTFVNADIILLDDFYDTFVSLRRKLDNFVAVGQRTDIKLEHQIDFSDEAQREQLLSAAKTSGTLHGEWGLDYFIHSKEQMKDFNFLPFLAGVYRWDNWLLSEFIEDQDITVVDATNSIQVLHQDNESRSAHSSRHGAEYNHKLAISHSGNQYRIGNVFFADYRLSGKCVPTSKDAQCSIIANEDRDADLILMFRRMSNDRNLAILTVNTGYFDMALNWICWARRIGFSNYVMLAEDLSSYRRLQEMSIEVVVVKDAPEEKLAAEYGTKEFQDTMMYRTNFLYKALYHGINIMTADVDAVWMDDPFRYVDAEAVVQGQQHKVTKISGGLVFVRSTNVGKKFWEAVIQCQRKNIEFINSHKAGTFTPSDYDEQYCINDISERWEKKGVLKRHLLLNNRFPDGKAFFEELIPQRSGTSPVVIHNNWIVGLDSKIERFKKWSLWAVQDDKTCSKPDYLPRPSLTKEEMDFQVKILTFNRPESLERLLKSLAAARYGADSVSLTVSIDFSSSSASEQDKELREQCIAIAEEFKWVYGSFHVEVAQKHRGLVGQWTGAWEPKNDNDIMVVFEDDLEVSRYWYTWAKSAVDAYYVKSYDPKLYGISLQHQYTILGENMDHKYGKRNPKHVLGDTSLYHYQLIGTWGTILFPQHWKQFTSWYATAKEGEPCVSNLISNKWWKNDPRKVWSQWFVRFAYEQGYYMLYTNFRDGKALTVNHREAGLNFRDNQGATNDMLRSLTIAELSLPNAEQIPTYDFHFQRAPANSEALAYRRTLFPATDDADVPSPAATFLNQCMTYQNKKRRR